MSFTPYIHFDGTCAEAMTFYAGLFGATDLQIMRYSEAPPEAGDVARSDRVMHSQFTVKGAPLMASDFPPGTGDKQAAVSIMFDVPDATRGAALCDALAEGGSVIMPFGPTFFAPGFGMVKDRFGTHWMISALQG
ncbi:VOC family protein [Ostreiculturibacter nitratireducens]|uniref:VOC family protein n=1 Tax=Ostreiculturibacter nitratireducens TaxID=3075226 RepID=UPI0031B59D35